MKVFIDGKDNMGWHIDVERKNILRSISRIGVDYSESFLSSNIIHNIWWNNLSRKITLFSFLKKNILVTTSNFVNLDDPEYILWGKFNQIRNIAKAWIAPSKKQLDILERNGLRCYYQPFYLDLDFFKPPAQSKKEICKKLSIAPEIFEDKIVIGSFQRDSLGSDLSKPKWQKGPELLIDLLKALPREKYILFIAGPRRHYVIKECKKHNIPYFYLGEETNEDDVEKNMIDVKKMPDLYALTDIYLITSASEGGPKAAMEATATKTFITSTDVGLAKDFIQNEFVFTCAKEYKTSLRDFVSNYSSKNEHINEVIEKQFEDCVKILEPKAMDSRLAKIYEDIING